MALCANCGWDIGDTRVCTYCGEAVCDKQKPAPRADMQGLSVPGSQQSAPPPMEGSGASQGVPPRQITVKGGAADIRRPSNSAATGLGTAAGCIGLALIVGFIMFLMFLSDLMSALSCPGCSGSGVGLRDLGIAPAGFMFISSSLRGVLHRD